MKDSQKGWAFKFNIANSGLWVGLTAGVLIVWPWKPLFSEAGISLFIASSLILAGLSSGFLSLQSGIMHLGRADTKELRSSGSVSKGKDAEWVAHAHIGTGFAGLIRAISLVFNQQRPAVYYYVPLGILAFVIILIWANSRVLSRKSPPVTKVDAQNDGALSKAFIAWIGFFTVAGCFLIASGQSYRPVMVNKLIVYVFASLVLVLAVFTFWRGFFRGFSLSRVSGRVLLVLCALFCAVPSLFISSTMLMLVNGAADSVPAMLRITSVVNTYARTSSAQSRGQRPQSYFAVLKPWISGGNAVTLQISPEDYRRIRKGETEARLSTRVGRLGWEWIDGVSYDTPK